MFPPIISLRHEPGIKFLYGLGVDVPAYNFFKAWTGIEFLHGLGVDVPPIHRAECLDIINYSQPLKRGNLNVSAAH